MGAVAFQPIIRTKLYAPRLPAIVPRPRLQEQLNAAKSAKLIAVVAGAGYGKSTLAAEFLHGLGQPFAWYQLEDTDADLSEFLAYLIAGLKIINPDFGERTLEQLTAADNVNNQSKAILSTFIAELDNLAGEDLFIALDDFHTVNESKSIVDAMDFILSHMLPNLHFMVLSRIGLSFDLFGLRARRELLEVDETELCFNHQETSTLFRDVFAMPLDDPDILNLFESTEGWISGLVLFYLALKGKGEVGVSSMLRELGGAPSAISDFLSKAVYENQSDAIKRFLIETSILSRMNPTFCEQLLDMRESADMLSHLNDERLFTIPLDDRGDWYRYHHCLGAFLQETLRSTYSPDSIKQLNLRAAQLWREYGEPETALGHYLDAEEHEQAAEVLSGIARQLLRGNRVAFLDRVLGRIPEPVLRSYPKLMICGTQIASMTGDYDRVVAASRAAADEFGKMGNPELQAHALLALAEGLIVQGRFADMRKASAEARGLIPEGSPLIWKALALDGMACVLMGEGDAGEKNLQAAEDHADDIPDAFLRSTMLGWCGLARFLQGRSNQAVKILEDAKTMPEGAGLTHTHPYVYAVLSRTYCYLDRLEEARLTAEEAVSLGEENGLIPMAVFGYATRATAWACLQERERAFYDASIASALGEKYESFAEALDTEWFLGETYGLLGETDTALLHWKRFARFIEPYFDARYIAMVGLGILAFETGEREEALAMLQESIAILKLRPSSLALSLAQAAHFRLLLASGEREQAIQALEEYIGGFGDDIVLRIVSDELDDVVEVFSDLFSQGRYIDLMERLSNATAGTSATWLRKVEKGANQDAASKAAQLLTALPREAALPLHIRMLGFFEVDRAGKSIGPKTRKSKKALAILKYMAANRERGGVPRDVLMELLWPEMAPEVASKNLNVALSSLRKTLEPETVRGRSSYLVSQGDLLRLELGPGGWIDLESFRELGSEAEKAKETGNFDLYFQKLKSAIELYRGDFLTGDLYEDWCRAQRDSLMNKFVDLVVDLSTEYLRMGESGEALVCLDDGLTRNPGKEELYRKRMMICSQMGNRAGIETTFQRCSKFLHENYEVEPSAETIQVYQRLRKE